MDKIVRELELTLIRPLQNINIIRKPEEKAIIANEEYYRNLAQINSAQQKYMERLEEARKSGAIDDTDYVKAIRGVSGLHSPFQEMIREAERNYRDAVEFD